MIRSERRSVPTTTGLWPSRRNTTPWHQSYCGPVTWINPDTMAEWRKDPEFSEAIEKATSERLLLRLERIEAGDRDGKGQLGH
jgi:hypothetical protein